MTLEMLARNENMEAGSSEVSLIPLVMRIQPRLALSIPV
jgi:hypothetical protein